MKNNIILQALLLIGDPTPGVSGFENWGAENCIAECFEEEKFDMTSTRYYCQHGREFGFCCPDQGHWHCQPQP